MRSLVYDSFGPVMNSLKLINDLPVGFRNSISSISTCEKLDIHVKWMASPINPSDINQIEGFYPIKPYAFPAVPGNEGVGQIFRLPPAYQGSLRVGDWVIPKIPGLGIWREESICYSDELLKIDNTLPLHLAAMLHVNPPTAYLLLSDDLVSEQGFLLIQNGANSAVGQSIIQIAKIRSLRTINIIRQRPDFDIVEKSLKELGADMVISDTELENTQLLEKKILDSFGTLPILGLNCVGGINALGIAKLLKNDGVLVTYGAMSKKPIVIPASMFIFKNIIFKGFWLSRWYSENQNNPLHHKMFNELGQWIKDGRFKLDYTTHTLDSWKHAIDQATNSQFTTKKHLLLLSN